jgi:hypothetical protein
LIDLAQKGFDYTQKTQALAQERDQLAPYQGIAKIMLSDPIRAAQIAQILSGQAQQPPQAQPAQKKFDDPIEQLKWETKQEAIAEMRQELVQGIAPLHRQQALNQVKMAVQTDPDFREIQSKILDMVKSQPPALQKSLFAQLDQDPASYLETFNYFKQQKAPPTETKETTAPKPAKKETHAPLLDKGGVEAPDVIEGKERTQRINKMKAKALRSGDPSEIANWLKESGAIDHLY